MESGSVMVGIMQDAEDDVAPAFLEPSLLDPVIRLLAPTIEVRYAGRTRPTPA